MPRTGSRYPAGRKTPGLAHEKERLLRDRALVKFNSEFVEAVGRGAQAIVNRTVTPLNAFEEADKHMFIFNNIFFIFSVDGYALLIR